MDDSLNIEEDSTQQAQKEEKRRKATERKRKSREIEKQNRSKEERLKAHREYIKARNEKETHEETLQHKCRHAESQQKYVRTKRQKESPEEVTQQRQKETATRKNCQTKKKMVFIARQALDCFNENNVECHSVGKMAYKCVECNALMFKEEKSNGSLRNESNAKFSLCCSYDAVKLPPIKEPPQIIKDLLIGTSRRDWDFCSNIRAYNSS